ncbi:MAG: hypothetical protein IIB40_03575 [Candidatus Marinimicrobia bacterium]|nr:hypothetical protein [Candidatus Neomarinimicrobiota bacterium]
MAKLVIQNGYPLICALIIFGMMGLGCAGFMNGTQHQLSVESNPQTAYVSIMSNGIEVSTGRTPFVTYLSRKKEYIVIITLDGYEEAQVPVTHQGIQGWYWGNLLFGGLGVIGLIIDFVNGAMYNMGPSDINVSLRMAFVPETETEELFAVISAYDDYGELRTTWERLVRSTKVQPELISSF